MAIFPVTALPKGGIYHGQVYLVFLFRGRLLLLSPPFSPQPRMGATDDGDELVLRPNKLISMLGEKSLAFRLRKLRLDDDIAYMLCVPIRMYHSRHFHEYWMSL
jgi:hypothetical protein